MNNLLNPADYDLTEDYNVYTPTPQIKFLFEDIEISLNSEGKVYLNKVELQVARECDAVKYFMNITMRNMYLLISGTRSLDYIRNIGS